MSISLPACFKIIQKLKRLIKFMITLFRLSKYIQNISHLRDAQKLHYGSYNPHQSQEKGILLSLQPLSAYFPQMPNLRVKL